MHMHAHETTDLFGDRVERQHPFMSAIAHHMVLDKQVTNTIACTKMQACTRFSISHSCR